MGLAAKLKSMFGGGNEVEPRFECATCGETFETEHQICTQCGGTDIEAL